jgi:hypothetical protein
MKKHEEYGRISKRTGWIFIIMFTALIITWCMLIMVIVHGRPRQWDFGGIKDTPSESIYSTDAKPGIADVPVQISPLPEASPLEQELTPLHQKEGVTKK